MLCLRVSAREKFRDLFRFRFVGLVYEPTDAFAQSSADPLEQGNRDVAVAGFDLREVALRDVGCFGQSTP